MAIKEKIKHFSKEFHQETIALRRHLHAHPELSFQEKETSSYVATQLEKLNISYKTGIADTGIVALIEGKNPSKSFVALRADMDALPIFEENDVPYKSKNTGVMHACGHDVHTSSLLGTAKILSQLKDEFEGTIKLIFQPAEERFPGGASLMIKEGVLENPKPASIIGQHVYPDMEAGKVGFKAGKYMASADELYLTITGKGGHAALPHLLTDPVVIASNLIVALQQLVSRYSDPFSPVVLSFGNFIANGSTNVIPDTVQLEGTLRTMDESLRAQLHQKLKQFCVGMVESMGAKCDIEVRKGYPFLINDEDLTNKMKDFAKDFLGEENVLDIPMRMGAEDFAYYSQIIPACFYRLGTRNTKEGIISGLHTPTFNIDENALELSTGLMSWLALKELGNDL